MIDGNNFSFFFFFCVILLTNKQTNKQTDRWKHNLLGGGQQNCHIYPLSDQTLIYCTPSHTALELILNKNYPAIKSITICQRRWQIPITVWQSDVKYTSLIWLTTKCSFIFCNRRKELNLGVLDNITTIVFFMAYIISQLWRQHFLLFNKLIMSVNRTATCTAKKHQRHLQVVPCKCSFRILDDS